MEQLSSQLKTITESMPLLEDVYGKLTKEELLGFSNIIHKAVSKNFNTSIPQIYMRIPKVLNFDEGVAPQQDPAKTVPQELPKEAHDVDTSKSQWYLEIPKAITAIQWTGNNQQAMEEFCNNGRYRISDNGDGTLRLADSERTTVINQGDYVASLKSGFSVYKADDFVREYQFIEKNSEAQPGGFEQAEEPLPPPPEEPLPPPPEGDAMQAFSIISSVASAPSNALGKIKSINNKINKGNWIEKMQTNNLHETGKQLTKWMPGQKQFNNILEEKFSIIGKAVGVVKDAATNLAIGTANQAVGRLQNQAMNKVMPPKKPAPAQFNDIHNIGQPDTLDRITAIVIKKQCWKPSLDTGRGNAINTEIDNLLGNALSGDLTKQDTLQKDEDKMTEIFGI